MRPTARLLWLLLLLPGGNGCSDERARAARPVTFADDVAPIFQSRCARCHEGAGALGGFRTGSFLDVVGCVPSGSPATLPPDQRAPLVAALSEPPHQGLLSDEERALVERWVASGAPARVGAVHPAGIVDPRSTDFHGARLRAERWRSMLDPSADQACGRCHDGAPVRPDGVSSPAPSATSCRACHSEPEGALACSTCHGKGPGHAPPRDACYFPEESARAGAHARHLAEPRLGGAQLDCSSCHPAPTQGPSLLTGTHGDGKVDVALDAKAIPGGGTYDLSTRSCSVWCHQQGGPRQHPGWDEGGPMGCGDCHGAPPSGHFPGECTTCHQGVDAKGSALSSAMLHLNGKVDLGDGSGTCSACHGRGGGKDGWPQSGSHGPHRTPELTLPVGCDNCHPVPDTPITPGHMDGLLQVAFGGRALDRDSQPVWDGASCSAVACHGAGLVDPPKVVPVWGDQGGKASDCGACHGVPPTQHTPSTSCQRSDCHGGEVVKKTGGYGITEAGKSLHVNGAIDENK